MQSSAAVEPKPQPILLASAADEASNLHRRRSWGADKGRVMSLNDVEEGTHGLCVTNIKERFDHLFESRQEVNATHCLKKVQERSMVILASKRMDYAMYGLIFGAWILLTTANSMQLYYDYKDKNNKRAGTQATIVLGIIALVIQGAVAALWFTHSKVKGKLADEKRDKELVERFVQALKDQKLASIETAHTVEPLPQDHLKAETQECIKHYDNLPHAIKEKIPPRDLWIIGLIKGLPPTHPLQAKLQRMLSTASQVQQAASVQPSLSDGESARFSDDDLDNKSLDKKSTIESVLRQDLGAIEEFVGCKTNLMDSIAKPMAQ